MAKYSFEFKKKIVLEYLSGKGGGDYLASKYSVGSSSQIIRWVNAYKEFGDDGLIRSRKNTSYSFEFKLHVVELNLSSKVSYQELALSQGINNPSLITRWVHDYQAVDTDALRPKKKGCKNTMHQKDNNNQMSLADECNVDTSVKHVKELEDELLKLLKLMKLMVIFILMMKQVELLINIKYGKERKEHQ